MKQKTLLEKARKVRDAARAQGDLARSNRIHSLLYLATKAGDNTRAKPGDPLTALDKLESELRQC